LRSKVLSRRSIPQSSGKESVERDRWTRLQGLASTAARSVLSGAIAIMRLYFSWISSDPGGRVGDRRRNSPSCHRASTEVRCQGPALYRRSGCSQGVRHSCYGEGIAGLLCRQDGAVPAGVSGSKGGSDPREATRGTRRAQEDVEGCRLARVFISDWWATKIYGAF
jgi:hypothetical protein